MTRRKITAPAMKITASCVTCGRPFETTGNVIHIPPTCRTHYGVNFTYSTRKK